MEIKDSGDFSRLSSRFPLDSFQDVKSELFFSQNPFDQKAIDVSICIPTFNRLDMLQICLDSVGKQKTNLSFEVVITDNTGLGSPEYLNKLRKLLSSFPFLNIRCFVNEKNIGGYGNWNRSFFLAKGEWVTLVHDDDFLHPLFLKSFERFLKRPDFSDVSVIGSRLFFFDGTRPSFEQEKEQFIASTKNKLNLSFSEINPIIYFGKNDPDILGSLIKKTALLQSGGFPEKGSNCEDWFFMAKLSDEFRCVCINNFLYGYVTYNLSDSSRDSVWTSIFIDLFFFQKELINKYHLVGFRYSRLGLSLLLYSRMISFQFFAYKKRALDFKEVLRKTGHRRVDFFFFYLPLLARAFIKNLFFKQNGISRFN